MTNGLFGMAIAAVFTILLLLICASETQEKFDKALAKEIEDWDA